MNVDDACASFQAAVIDILCDRTAQCHGALPRRIFPDATRPTLVVAGGVAANRAIGSALDANWRKATAFDIRIPPAQALHRQCGDDRLGGAGAVRGRRSGSDFDRARARAGRWTCV